MPSESELQLQQILEVTRAEISVPIRRANGAQIDPVGGKDGPWAFVDAALATAREVLAKHIQSDAAGIGTVELLRVAEADVLGQSLKRVVEAGVEAWAKVLELQGPDRTRDRDSALVELIVREFARQRPEVIGQIVAVARQARQARVEKQSDQLVKPVDALVGDPLVEELSRLAKGVGLRFFSGYLGTSDLVGYRRLFSSLEFTSYLDIPSSAVLQTVDLRTPTNPLGGTAVWVRVGAEIIRGQTATTRMEVQSSFLGGGIAGQYGGRMSGAAMGAGGSIGCTSPEYCASPVGCTSPEYCFSPVGCTSPEYCRQ